MRKTGKTIMLWKEFCSLLIAQGVDAQRRGIIYAGADWKKHGLPPLLMAMMDKHGFVVTWLDDKRLIVRRRNDK